MTDNMEIDVSFVAQRGEIEAMACLLAAALRRHHGDRLHLHVIEPVPEAEYGTVSPAARRFLDSMDVRWYQRENPVSHDYKIFNKLNAFRIEPQTDKTLFLDSDILVRAPLDGLQHYFGSQFAARMENQQRYSGREDAWKAAYGLFDLPVPEARWLTVDTSEWGPPYFNAGVVLVDSCLNFSEVWSDTCRRIHESDEIWEIARDQHRGTVQIGMPVAMARLGLKYELLSGAYHIFLNRQMRRRRLNWPEEQVKLVHYNEWTHVLSDERIAREVGDLIVDFSLEPVFEGSEETRSFLKTLRSATYEPRRSLFLPSSLLRDVTQARPEPGKTTRVRVLAMPGAGITASTTAEDIEVLDDAASVRRIATLALDLKEDLDTRVVLLIADPLSSIERWEHDAGLWRTTLIEDLTSFDMSRMSEHLSQRLAALQAVKDPSQRRAGLWEFLATAANQPHANLRIIRREDLLETPDIAASLAAWCGFLIELQADADTSGALDDAEMRTIRNVCSFIAGAFGYTL